MSRQNQTVFSTEFGRHCSQCGRLLQKCICDLKNSQAFNPADSIVRVRLEKKGRGGKEVTTVSGIPGTKDDALSHLTKLKKKLGTGGSWKDGSLEIQGNRVELILAYFKENSLPAKKSGG